MTLASLESETNNGLLSIKNIKLCEKYIKGAFSFVPSVKSSRYLHSLAAGFRIHSTDITNLELLAREYSHFHKSFEALDFSSKSK